MATIRDGSKGVLLVVDAQVGVLNNAWQTQRVVANIAHAVERARAERVPVIWVQHESDALARGSAPWQLVPELVPADAEVVLGKRFNSSFEDTALEATLAGLSASHIALAGAATNWCIRATAYAALERGYDLTLLSDAHSTAAMDLGGGVEVDPAQVVHDLNTVTRWLSYPNRTCRSAAVADMDFAKLR